MNPSPVYFEIDGALLKRMLKRLAPVAKQSQEFGEYGIKFIVAHGHLRVTAFDGHRLAVCQVAVAVDPGARAAATAVETICQEFRAGHGAVKVMLGDGVVEIGGDCWSARRQFNACGFEGYVSFNVSEDDVLFGSFRDAAEPLAVGELGKIPVRYCGGRIHHDRPRFAARPQHINEYKETGGEVYVRVKEVIFDEPTPEHARGSVFVNSAYLREATHGLAELQAIHGLCHIEGWCTLLMVFGRDRDVEVTTVIAGMRPGVGKNAPDAKGLPNQAPAPPAEVLAFKKAKEPFALDFVDEDGERRARAPRPQALPSAVARARVPATESYHSPLWPPPGDARATHQMIDGCTCGRCTVGRPEVDLCAGARVGPSGPDRGAR